MSESFRKIQWAQELINGTAVAADEKLVGLLTMTPDKGFLQPVESRGSLAQFRRSSTISQMCALELSGNVTYQQFLHTLAMSLKGAVEPASLTATGAKHDDNGVFADLTNALDDMLGTHETIVGFIAADDKLYIRAAAAFRGTKITLAGTVNALAGLISTVEVSDGSTGWITATLIKDRTVSAGVAMARTGIIEWTMPTTWLSDTVDGDAGFWVRLTFSADWTASVQITEIDTVPETSVWSFIPNLNATNAQNSYTIEYGDDTQAWEASHCLATSWELSGSLNAGVDFRSSLFGNYPSKVTFTPSLGEPAGLIDVVSNNMQVFIDTTWAGLGTTEKTTLVTGFTIRLPSTGLVPLKTANGNNTYSVVKESPRYLEIELEMLMGADAITEYDAFDAETIRNIRLRFTGPTIEGANKHELTFDVTGKYMSSPQLLGTREGGNVFSLILHSFEDDAGNEFNVSGQTARATL